MTTPTKKPIKALLNIASLKFFKINRILEPQYISKEDIKKGHGEGPTTCNLHLQNPIAAHLLNVEIL